MMYNYIHFMKFFLRLTLNLEELESGYADGRSDVRDSGQPSGGW
jgi:hypothetical protein